MAAKRAAVECLADRLPQVRWVLVGDNGGHDPAVFAEFARGRPDRVAVIALRQVLDAGRPEAEAPSLPGPGVGVAVIETPNGEELLPRLRAGLGLERPRQAAVGDWFLTEFERGNDATRLRAWTEGNTARPLVHGRTYFSVLAEALAGAAAGDPVLFAGWRGDADELLAEHGPTVVEALSGAARRGAVVRGCCGARTRAGSGTTRGRIGRWPPTLPPPAVRCCSTSGSGRWGCHHQKLVVIRHLQRPHADVVFLGGIDLDRGSRNDADHGGDPQPVASNARYGRTPAVHDVQVELRGPAVREADDLFRERWEDPAALSRLLWHVIPDRLHGLRRTASPLPAAHPTRRWLVAARCRSCGPTPVAGR